MKKIGIYIVCISGIILLSFYGIKIISPIPIQIINHEVVKKQYPEVWFSMDQSGLQVIKDLQLSGVKCQKEYRDPFGNYIVCYKATGFEHIYTIPSLHIKIIPYKTMYPYYNSGLFSTGDLKPFFLSGDAVYQTDITIDRKGTYQTYIKLKTYEEGETQQTILSDKDNSNILPTGTIGTESYFSLVNRKIAPDENNGVAYAFDSQKKYYYQFVTRSWCLIGACGLEQHRIFLFKD